MVAHILFSPVRIVVLGLEPPVDCAVAFNAKPNMQRRSVASHLPTEHGENSLAFQLLYEWVNGAHAEASDNYWQPHFFGGVVVGCLVAVTVVSGVGGWGVAGRRAAVGQLATHSHCSLIRHVLASPACHVFHES